MRFYRCKKTLRQLAEKVRPESGWQARQREILLAEIRRSSVWRSAVEPTATSGFLLPNWALFKGAGLPVLAAVVVFAGFIGTVSTARSSLPGDAFYPVKISLERAQVGLAFSQEKKAELEMAFAGSRLQEANDLIAREGAGPAAAAHISQAMDHFNAGLSSVQKRLTNIKKVNVSALVNDTTLVLEDDLLGIKSKISSASSSDSASIEKALKTVAETNTSSLSAIIREAVAAPDNNEAREEALAKLQTKIQRIENQETLEQIVKDDSKKPEEARKSLEEAKKILETNDPSKLNDVLSIIKELK